MSRRNYAHAFVREETRARPENSVQRLKKNVFAQMGVNPVLICMNMHTHMCINIWMWNAAILRRNAITLLLVSQRFYFPLFRSFFTGSIRAALIAMFRHSYSSLIILVNAAHRSSTSSHIHRCIYKRQNSQPGLIVIT